MTFSIAFNDSTGNAGVAVTAVTDGSSVTYDDTVPTLTAVGIASNNATSTIAKEGDVVTLTLTASETIGTPTVTFQSGGDAITDTSITLQ